MWNDKKQAWQRLSQLIPGDPIASMSHHSLLGRQLYMFACEPDDSASAIFQSVAGADAEFNQRRLREVQMAAGTRLIKKLADGDQHELMIRTDRMIAPAKLRFRHVTIDYGTRKCEVCREEMAASRFGRHVFGHSDAELDGWPGGGKGVLKALRGSLRQSLKAAEGFPRIQAALRQSSEVIEQLQRRTSAHDN